jgi:hypothetical protein
MTRITVKSRVDSNGILHLDVPIGPADADREVKVTIEPAVPETMSQEEWRQAILDTAGKWQGDFERP